MPVGAKSLATPSAVMMKGLTRSATVGSALTPMSGMSAPPQDEPLQESNGRSSRHGLPVVGFVDAPL